MVHHSQECIALEELYLSHNGIQKMEGLSTLQNLRILDVSSNKLTAINDIDKLTKYKSLSFVYSPPQPLILFPFLSAFYCTLQISGLVVE